MYRLYLKNWDHSDINDYQYETIEEVRAHLDRIFLEDKHYIIAKDGHFIEIDGKKPRTQYDD